MRLYVLFLASILGVASFFAAYGHPDENSEMIGLFTRNQSMETKGTDYSAKVDKGRVLTKAKDQKKLPTATLNFNHADLESVIRAVSYFVQKDFLLDPHIHGTINLISNGPVSREQAYGILLAALRMQGFAVVEEDKFVKVLLRSDARSEFNANSSLSGVSDDSIVTKIVDLQNSSATQVSRAIRPVLSPRGIISAYPDKNTIILSDYKDNVVQAVKVIKKLDARDGRLDRVFLKNYTAYDMSVLVAPLIDPKTTGLSADPGQRVSVLPDRDSNSIIVYGGTKDYRKHIVEMIGDIDDKVNTSSNYHIVYLKYADANYLADTLRSVFSRSAGKVGGPAATSVTPSSPGNVRFSEASHAAFSNNQMGKLSRSNLSSSSKIGSTDSDSIPEPNNGPESVDPVVFPGVTIAPDESINALVIYAPHEIYIAIRDLIEQLDVRRAQLFIESLIVEISSDHSGDVGFQFGGMPKKGAFAMTNFYNSGSSVIQDPSGINSLGAGLIVGLLRGMVTLPGGKKIIDLTMLAKFLETQTHTNILSKPNLLTLDNQEAKIVVGQNVPFVTGQYVPSSGTAPQQPFQTIERQDVGLTLNIRPQIMKDGVVKLDIYQEVSSVQPKSSVDGTNSAADIVTSKRSIRSTVLVNDGQIVALGGLIEDKLQDSSHKVPFFGNLPILGALFRSDSRTHQKTNLIIFLRPIIIRNAKDMDPYTIDRYRYLRVLQRKEKLPDAIGMPRMESPILPDISGTMVAKEDTYSNSKLRSCLPESRYLVGDFWSASSNCKVDG
ncbi:putative type II secretion system protein D [Candidatus Ichthyocystis hellenicum]|uniref:Putative type II secretion system protein D n=1 Tax=Candidatus Ichthyocystis hellenicum TaxID=1561003 RepID=A0A0S4M0F7_9BURK|nr:type II secretion system secretin GspD [Candidatus Ichthyocystis hellenicum]CUT17214.1 putative type II secretion system protein D [Candidatus Ichthyocystis hellenicum]